jgi:predicted transcriptional regulator
LDYNALSKDIFDLDTDIRFSGVCDSTGNIKYGGLREGLTPLLSPEENKEANLLAFQRWRLSNVLAKKMGGVRYAMEEYEKVKIVTFALPDEHLLLVSLEVESNHSMIIEKIIKKILYHCVNDFL